MISQANIYIGDTSHFRRQEKIFKNVVASLTGSISISHCLDLTHTKRARCAPHSFYPHSFTL